MHIGNLDLGRLPLVLAPLAGYSNPALRAVCRDFGATLTVTEMISAEALVIGRPTSKSRIKSLAMMQAEAEDHPVAAQLFGKDPERLAAAARVVQEETACDLIDLNAGCPVRKVVSSGHGVALMRDPLLLGRIVDAMRKVIHLPFTVKLRAGCEEINVVECSRIAVEAGADAITVHPRLRHQMFAGQADWSLITRVKEAIQRPVIGNGDVKNAADALRLVKETGCDAVMIGRAAVVRPWIFAEARAALDDAAPPSPPDGSEKFRLLQRLLMLMNKYNGEKRAANEIRKYALHLVKGTSAAVAARREIATAPTPEKMLKLVRKTLIDAQDPI